MRGMVAALSIMVLSTTTAEADDDFCKPLGELASNIMTKRQSGTDISEMMHAVDAASNDAFKQFAKALIIQAYDYPMFSSEEVQRKTIAEFSNETMLSCYRRMQSK